MSSKHHSSTFDVLHKHSSVTSIAECSRRTSHREHSHEIPTTLANIPPAGSWSSINEIASLVIFYFGARKYVGGHLRFAFSFYHSSALFSSVPLITGVTRAAALLHCKMNFRINFGQTSNPPWRITAVLGWLDWSHYTARHYTARHYPVDTI